MSAETIPFDVRRTYLGSHDTSAIFGLNQWKRPIDVYLQKIGLATPTEQTERQEWGLRLEDSILKAFFDKTGFKSVMRPSKGLFVRHEKYHWLGGTPDALVYGKKAGVDAKNIGWNRGDWGTPGTDEVPTYILTQCHHFLTLFDYDEWYVAVLFGGNKFETYRVERNRKISEMIIEEDGAFWREHIEADIPPPEDGSDSYKDYLLKQFPRDNGTIREAEQYEIELLEEYIRLKPQVNRFDEIKNMFKVKLKSNAGFCCNIGKVTYKADKGRESIDVAKLRKELPEVAKKYTKVSEPTRRLNITIKEGGK